MTESPLGLGIATRRVLADVVTDDLRDAIIAHELEPGRRLAEDDLANQMGVSRGPVREALARLEREGLIVIERHKGARIASWGKSDVEEIFSLRVVLEQLAIEWACKNATAADIAALEGVIKEFRNLSEKQRNIKNVSRLDLEFHSAIFNAAHHDRLYRAWEILRSQIHSFLIYTWTRDEVTNKSLMNTWDRDHQVFAHIIKKRDVEKGLKEINAHVERGLARVSKHFVNEAI
ncbi:MAG: GntR family transcriptional regulator [Actinobacteria bacterium]|nr:GntR family transcriptional regulator [Actinomycetota bacterium]